MMKKWSWFGAAAVMSAYALLNFGAPLVLPEATSDALDAFRLIAQS